MSWAAANFPDPKLNEPAADYKVKRPRWHECTPSEPYKLYQQNELQQRKKRLKKYKLFIEIGRQNEISESKIKY